MPLTLTVTLDDGDVQTFIDKYNADAGTEITADIVNQNILLHEAIAEDMIHAWFISFEDEDRGSVYDLYSEFFEDQQNEDEELIVLEGDPALVGVGNDDSFDWL